MFSLIISRVVTCNKDICSARISGHMMSGFSSVRFSYWMCNLQALSWFTYINTYPLHSTFYMRALVVSIITPAVLSSLLFFLSKCGLREVLSIQDLALYLPVFLPFALPCLLPHLLPSSDSTTAPATTKSVQAPTITKPTIYEVNFLLNPFAA